MDFNTYLYGSGSREKYRVYWGKGENNFPFFATSVNPKIPVLQTYEMSAFGWGGVNLGLRKREPKE